MTLDRLLTEVLPHRMRAVDTLNLALWLDSNFSDPPRLEIFVDGKLRIEGNLYAFTNPAIEAGLVHCRALLEFLGLSASRSGHIVNVAQRRSTDIGVEHFANSNGNLRMVDPDAVLSRYGGGRDEAEKALLTVFRMTNKGMAHVTEDLKNHPEDGRLMEVASRGVPSLVVSYLYTPLGLPAPDYKLTHRLAAE